MGERLMRSLFLLIIFMPLFFLAACNQDSIRSEISVQEIPNTDDNGNTVCKKTAQLNWLKPTTNEDGSPLTDLASYRIFYGTSSRNYASTINLADPNLLTYQVTELAPGNTYYFAIKSINSIGMESQYSGEVSLSLPACQ